MTALVCDICGGKLVMGAGGVATCESCGMQHSVDRMKEKVQEIKGTVRIDNTHMINNYIEMAQSAKEVGNNSEAESYCNKAIEIDPTNYRAWLIKGKAVVWQSTLEDSRVDEGVAAFIKAIANSPDKEKENIIEDTKDEIKKLAFAILSRRADRFATWPDEEEAVGFISDITSIIGTLVNFLSETGVVIPISELMGPIASQINESVVRAYQEVIWPDYNGDPNDSDDRAGKYEWQTFIKRLGYCTSLVEKAIDLCDEDDEEDIQRYKNLIFLHKQAIDSCSWNYDLTDWGSRSWYIEWALTDKAKEIRRRKIRDYESKIAAIESEVAAKKEAEAKERIKQYWSKHLEEKVAFEKEREDLQQEISKCESEIARIPGAVEVKNINDRINQLSSEKSALGLFKMKEKKAIQEKIDAQNIELNKLQDRMSADRAEIQRKIASLQSRINEINYELTKER